MDDLHKRLARRIRELARKRRWSANQLADFSGISRGYLSEVLAAKKSPTIRTLSRIAEALEVPLREVLP